MGEAVDPERSSADPAYEDMIAEEARVWSQESRRDTERWLPDWRVYKNTWPYRTYRRKWTELFFETIPPGSVVLEIGCNLGWFALELARQGCHVTGVDVAEGAIGIARDHLATVQQTETLPESLRYECRDVTVEALGSEGTYDFVMPRGVLHHLPDPNRTMAEVTRVLKPDGLFLIDDGRATGRREATIVAVLLTLLPTEMSYRKKAAHIWHNRTRLVGRAQAFIDREGDSPFEGVTGDADQLIPRYFDVTFSTTFAAVTGSLASQVRLPRPLKHALLSVSTVVDEFCVRLGLLHGSNFVMFARRRPQEQ